eukprot:UN22910
MFYALLIVLVGAWDKEKHNMVIAGVTRYFDVYTPAEFDKRTPLPLILSFHGWRDDGDFFGGSCEPDHPFCEWDKEVDSRKILFVRPYGLFKSWNAGMCCAPSSGGFLNISGINRTQIMQLSDPIIWPPSRFILWTPNCKIYVQKLCSRYEPRVQRRIFERRDDV